MLLTGSADKTARLVGHFHRAAAAGLQWSYRGSYRCLFTPDGQKIVTTSLDKTVRTWITDYNDLLAYACTLVGRRSYPGRTRTVRGFRR